MTKKITSFTLAAAFVVSAVFCFGLSAKAASSYSGKLIKMNGLSTVYYVASDGNRYVFPNEKIYKSWFSNFGSVLTIGADELQDIPLKGNILYRPGVVLVKVDSDPKIYAVTKNGVLRWLQNDAVAQALYGNNWKLLIDSLPDSFFFNYQVGSPIANVGDYNPSQEVEDVKTIEADINLAPGNAKVSDTGKCQIVGGVRSCKPGQATTDNNTNNNTNSVVDKTSPYITSIAVANGGNIGYVDAGDSITITFSEPINPKTINGSLVAGGSVSNIAYASPGGVRIYSSGKIDVNSIISFDIGSVNTAETYLVRLNLNSAGKVLTVTLTSGNDDQIINEAFSKAVQVGGQVEDLADNVMTSQENVVYPTGTFGGNVDDGSTPYIKSIVVENGGKDGYIDIDDSIAITFSEPIDPQSVNTNLERGGYVSSINDSEVAGLSIYSKEFNINGIASFYIGSVSGSGTFVSKVALNEDGDVLTITITSGNSIVIWDDNFTNANQISGTITDCSGNKMKSNSSLANPVGTFGGSLLDEANAGPVITGINVSNGGSDGYIDVNDSIVITFDKPIDPQSIHTSLNEGASVSDIAYSKRGGVQVNSDGLVTITDIASFDMGSVSQSGTFTDKIALNSSGKVLTITLTSGNDLKITKENFGNTNQVGGAVTDWEDHKMVAKSNIFEPTGTFGGVYGYTGTDDGFAPKINSIQITNGGANGYIDVGDSIAITFSEPIDPEIIDSSLHEGQSINGVAYSKTAGVSVFPTGLMYIQDIASLDVGTVAGSGVFGSRVALNSAGDVLTITLTSGSSVQITNKNFSDSKQTGGVIEDLSGNKMNSNSNLGNPGGGF
ncbi:MAG: hypothetical protein JW816_01760 [Candidatus Buchananbacteria bacterium]|nr:hypothetical protein [Candidatus Buchananbacteria bacterium]